MLDFGFYNMDCVEGMKQFPDNYFDLAIVDPPYGGALNTDAKDSFKGTNGRFGGRFDKYFKDQIEELENSSSSKKVERTGKKWAAKYGTTIKHWDIAPDQEYFDELFRVSKNQIIWGGNYFYLPPTRCFLVWKKLTISENFTMAMAEYAWTSFNSNAKVFEKAPQDKERFHPTQKPVELYEWQLNKYAKRDYKILDTHVGSGSSLVACRNCGMNNYVGFEINKEYYKKAKERIEKNKSQMNIFDLF